MEPPGKNSSWGKRAEAHQEVDDNGHEDIWASESVKTCTATSALTSCVNTSPRSWVQTSEAWSSGLAAPVGTSRPSRGSRDHVGKWKKANLDQLKPKGRIYWLTHPEKPEEELASEKLGSQLANGILRCGFVSFLLLLCTGLIHFDCSGLSLTQQEMGPQLAPPAIPLAQSPRRNCLLHPSYIHGWDWLGKDPCAHPRTNPGGQRDGPPSRWPHHKALGTTEEEAVSHRKWGSYYWKGWWAEMLQTKVLVVLYHCVSCGPWEQSCPRNIPTELIRKGGQWWISRRRPGRPNFQNTQGEPRGGSQCHVGGSRWEASSHKTGSLPAVVVLIPGCSGLSKTGHGTLCYRYARESYILY